jgi:hypothetical protein
MLISVTGFLGIFTFGFFVADIFLGRKAHILERIAAGFLLGSGIFTFVLFLANWKLNIPFGLKESLFIILSLNLIAFLINTFFTKKGKVKNIFDYNFNFKEGFENLNSLEKIIIGLILFLFFSSLIHNLYWPVLDWDALAVYDFRAKSFVATSFMQDAILRGYFTTYPLYTSLIHTFLYLFNFNNPVFIYTILYVSLIILSYFVLSRISGNMLLSLTFSLLISIHLLIFVHSTMSYTNLPFTVFLTSGFMYLVYYFYENITDTKTFFLGILLIALSGWVRVVEPFWLLSIPFLILLLVYTKKVFYFFITAIVLYVPRFLWFKFLSGYKFIGVGYDIKSAVSIESVILNITKFDHIKIMEYFYKNMLSPYNILLIVFTISLGLLVYIIFTKKLVDLKIREFVALLLPSALVLLSVLIMLLGLYVFVFNFGNQAYDIADSATRSTMPLLLFLLLSIILNLLYLYKFMVSEMKTL